MVGPAGSEQTNEEVPVQVSEPRSATEFSANRFHVDLSAQTVRMERIGNRKQTRI